MKKELISIILPIYNVEEYLERCLNSLLAQTYINFEAIMVNDGSTDSSAIIAKKFADKDKRFVLINQENAGQGAARNVGIDYANGKFVTFVDSDDYVHPEYLERLYSCLVANNADIAICGVERVWNSGESRRNPVSNNKEYIIRDKQEFLKNVSYASVDKIFRNGLFNDVRFPAHMKFEDYATIPRVIEKAQKIVAIPDALYYYYWRGNSTTNAVKVNNDILRAHKFLEETEFGNHNPSLIESYFVRNVMGSLLWSMACSTGYGNSIKSIMQEGKSKYNHLESYISKRNIGSPLFGKLLFRGHYKLAMGYAKTYNSVQNMLRPVYHTLLRFKGSVKN